MTTLWRGERASDPGMHAEEVLGALRSLRAITSSSTLCSSTTTSPKRRHLSDCAAPFARCSLPLCHTSCRDSWLLRESESKRPGQGARDTSFAMIRDSES